MFEQLSHGELVQLMELASRCLTVTTPAQIEKIISSINDIADYRNAALCALTVGGNDVTLTHYVNHSYGQWADVYARQGFHKVDPIIRHAATVEGAFCWDEVPPPVESASDFLAAAEAYGVSAGLSVSCAGTAPPFRSVLSVAGVPAAQIGRTTRILAAIGPHMHEAYRRVIDRPAVEPPAELSAREREVLCWAQQGKTYWEIGSILGISERTVKFHVARIKAKLDVMTTAHAIAKAMRSGLIA